MMGREQHADLLEEQTEILLKIPSGRDILRLLTQLSGGSDGSEFIGMDKHHHDSIYSSDLVWNRQNQTFNRSPVELHTIQPDSNVFTAVPGQMKEYSNLWMDKTNQSSVFGLLRHRRMDPSEKRFQELKFKLSLPLLQENEAPDPVAALRTVCTESRRVNIIEEFIKPRRRRSIVKKHETGLFYDQNHMFQVDFKPQLRKFNRQKPQNVAQTFDPIDSWQRVGNKTRQSSKCELDQSFFQHNAGFYEKFDTAYRYHFRNQFPHGVLEVSSVTVLRDMTYALHGIPSGLFRLGSSSLCLEINRQEYQLRLIHGGVKSLESAMSEFTLIGTCILRLENLATFLTNAREKLVFQAVGEALKSLLHSYQVYTMEIVATCSSITALLVQTAHVRKTLRTLAMLLYCSPILYDWKASLFLDQFSSSVDLLNYLDQHVQSTRLNELNPGLTRLLYWILERAAEPYLHIASKWLFQGLVNESDDPHDEFLGSELPEFFSAVDALESGKCLEILRLAHPILYSCCIDNTIDAFIQAKTLEDEAKAREFKQNVLNSKARIEQRTRELEMERLNQEKEIVAAKKREMERVMEEIRRKAAEREAKEAALRQQELLEEQKRLKEEQREQEIISKAKELMMEQHYALMDDFERKQIENEVKLGRPRRQEEKFSSTRITQEPGGTGDAVATLLYGSPFTKAKSQANVVDDVVEVEVQVDEVLEIQPEQVIQLQEKQEQMAINDLEEPEKEKVGLDELYQQSYRRFQQMIETKDLNRQDEFHLIDCDEIERQCQRIDQASVYLFLHELDLISVLKTLRGFLFTTQGYCMDLFTIEIHNALRDRIDISAPGVLDALLDRSIQEAGIESTNLFSYSIDPIQLNHFLGRLPDVSLDVMNHLELTFNIHWPLSILFPQEILHSYQQIHKFLLSQRIRRLNLNEKWKDKSSLSHEKLLQLHEKRYEMNVREREIETQVLTEPWNVLLQQLETSECLKEMEMALKKYITDLFKYTTGE